MALSMSLSMSAFVAPASSYTDITMECVSEFNWNQGQGDVFRTASPHFVGKVLVGLDPRTALPCPRAVRRWNS